MVGCQFPGTKKDCRWLREYFKTDMTKTADSIYEEPRAMPSFWILNWRVDRFIARRVAAPFGPATTQLLSLRALRIC